jgi:hypothetical protein
MALSDEASPRWINAYQEWEGLLEMQNCPLYVGVTLLVSHSVMVQLERETESGTRRHVTSNMARGLCPWGYGRIPRHHGSLILVSTA